MTTAVSNAVAPADGRPLVSAVKQQAKRLLRLAKKTPLEISALSQALEVASQMHGYPSWHALSASSGKPAMPTNETTVGIVPASISNKLLSADGPDYIERLADQARLWAGNPKASVNIITPHFQALKKMSGMEGVRFVSTEELLGLSPLHIPLGSRGLLPEHKNLLAELVVALANGRGKEHFVEPIVRGLIEIVQENRQESLYAPGLVPEEVLPKIENGSRPTWNEIRQRCILEGSFDNAVRIQTDVHLTMGISNLWECQRPEVMRKSSPLKDVVGHPILSEINAVLGRWKRSKPMTLPANGVVIFEVDTVNIDWDLSPEHQWLLAAYLGHIRRLPSAVAREREALPGKSYSISEQDLVWIRSISPVERKAVFQWYDDQLPELVFDVWDSFEGPAMSGWVDSFSGTVFNAVQRFRGEKTQVATWVAYKPLAQGEIPYRLQNTNVVRYLRGIQD